MKIQRAPRMSCPGDSIIWEGRPPCSSYSVRVGGICPMTRRRLRLIKRAEARRRVAYRECCAHAGCALNPHCATMPFCRVTDNAQPQACAPRVSRAGLVHSVEAFEHSVQVVVGDTYTSIFHGQDNLGACLRSPCSGPALAELPFQTDRYLTSLVRVSDCVVQQIANQLVEFYPVTNDVHALFGFYLQAEPLLR